MKTSFYFIICLLITSSIFGQKKLDYTLYLIGDTGNPVLSGIDPVLQALKSELSKENEQSAIVYLGDNIYNNGMPPPSQVEERQIAEQKMKTQLDALLEFKGKIYFVPGNHDWNNSGKNGRKFVIEQEKFIESYLNRGDVLLPDDGCPGPEVKKLEKDVILIAMDSEWWLHRHEDMDDFDNCKNKNQYEIIQELKDKLDKYDDHFIILAFHHPLYTNGSHNGFFGLREMFFPLTDINSGLYIPLPGLGFIYPFYRSTFGARQDLPHPLYQKFKDEVINALGDYDNVIIASGHEHNLQYYVKDDHHYIVSGSGSKTGNLRKINDAKFTSEKNGFAKIQFYKDGSAELQFYTIDNGAKLEFSEEIINKPLESSKNITPYDLSNEFVTKKASGYYMTSKFHQSLFGTTYRQDWDTEIEVRNLNLSTEHGGLRPIKKGGGYSSNSLRLEAPDDKQYVLRSVQKGVVKVVPPKFRGTFVQNIFQDQISASQPYAALAVPPLAKAAGVYYTNPEIVYLENQPALGDFNEVFANDLYLYEERPAGDREDEESLGGSKKIVSYNAVLEALRTNHRATINQKQVLRSRIFDILLGDWDRHDDQWRWATFEQDHNGKKHTYYEPIPRDRDQVFFGYKGLVPSLTKLLSPELRKFVYWDYEIKNLKYLGYNARHFDRHFMNQMTRGDWVSTAQELQQSLTSEAIQESIDAMPEPIARHQEQYYKPKLVQRKKDLVKYASEMYDFIAMYVDVVGTDKKELFEVIRNEDNTTQIRVIDLNKENEKTDTFYSRLIQSSETKEIRLYGLGGDDVFHIHGTQDHGSLIRIIGGKGDDEILDNSKVNGIRRKTIVYDNELETESNLGSEAKYKAIKDASENDYDRKDFYYDATINIPLFAYNPDDGFVVTNSFSTKKYGWRKKPYKSSHQLLSRYAFGSQEFSMSYTGEFIEALGNADFSLHLYTSIPSDKENFFGLGNDRSFSLDDFEKFNIFRYEQTRLGINPAVQFSSVNRVHKLKFGPYYEFTNLDDGQQKFIAELPLFESEKEKNNFVGIKMDYSIFKLNDLVFPTNGLDFKISPSYNHNLSNTDLSFFRLQGHLVAYNFIPLPRPFVWATRISGGVNYGDYSFYQANFLGRTTGFRGFRENRVGGKSSFVWSNDLRMKLFKVNGKVLPFSLGVIGSYDIGRVWLENEVSVEGWHRAYGGGVWISPFDIATVSFYYLTVRSNETFDSRESTFSIQFGFPF
jgi:predicted phosphodiesterase